MYSEKVIEHFQNPRNVGELPDNGYMGTAENTESGDLVKIYLEIEDGIVKDCRFVTFGCIAAVAASSVVTELVKGKSIKDARQITDQTVDDALDGLPPAQAYCSLLVREAVCAALRDYEERSNP